MPEKPAPENQPHPVALAWQRLADVNDALLAVQNAGVESLYRQTLQVTRRLAQQYLAKLDSLLEEMGE